MTPRPHPARAALARGLTRRRVSRRTALGLTGLSAAGLALSACGVQGQGGNQPAAEDFWAGKESNGRLDFANWPLYMDPGKPELAAFTEETGIRVDYDEAIQDNPTFFGKIQPMLAQGEPIGYDLIVLTNGIELTKLIELGYLAPLDHDRLPNFAENAGRIYKHTAYDSGNRHTVPYASGITGIAYNPDYVDREITAIADLWDPAFEGKVGMMADPQELANFGLLRIGVAPADSTEEDWAAAADALEEQRDLGLVRRYYSQDYIQPLSSGDIWMSMAWSGDIFQQNAEQGTNLRFVVPEEGGTLWSDNMMIPYTAPNPVDAIMLMDFLYDAEVAADLTEYITYIPPVPRARDILARRAEEAEGEERELLEQVVGSPLVFPSEADYDKLHNYVSVTTENEESFSPLFLAVSQS
ncbi:spermidine/putrescine ABC transporter substrate-binding protein [Streptomonospora sp. S1-112]|uniref:Spermidine/putrescine ABC transporter substrate-binding protein n=1 Tax=Streptomonospora mangrovi TaxID=2883123 RepID=A0A9X3SG12_9ACTN|nr:spermidine/putrescine ABC transporter substrate-binding protein [Streptomonospora mangrovi]MDA0565470.1 spermidine/putrescine ABC transporter substrate-binding protein [Streptomonospora mangrovi]